MNSKIVKLDPELGEAYEYGNILINSQSTEILKSYSFWSVAEASDKNENAIYELSCYNLKPGITVKIISSFN